jgi:hypothetical protein
MGREGNFGYASGATRSQPSPRTSHAVSLAELDGQLKTAMCSVGGTWHEKVSEADSEDLVKRNYNDGPWEAWWAGANCMVLKRRGAAYPSNSWELGPDDLFTCDW